MVEVGRALWRSSSRTGCPGPCPDSLSISPSWETLQPVTFTVKHYLLVCQGNLLCFSLCLWHQILSPLKRAWIHPFAWNGCTLMSLLQTEQYQHSWPLLTERCCSPFARFVAPLCTPHVFVPVLLGTALQLWPPHAAGRGRILLALWQCSPGALRVPLGVFVWQTAPGHILGPGLVLPQGQRSHCLLDFARNVRVVQGESWVRANSFVS